MKLENQQLEQWVAQGLISQTQANLICEYESTHGQKSWILSGFLILGAIVLLLGILSLVAANFYKIPNHIKLLTNFTLLGTMAVLLFKFYDSRKSLKFDILTLCYIGLCAISLALINQIYNINDKYYLTVFFWSAVTLVPAWYAKRSFVSFIWLLQLLVAIADYSNSLHITNFTMLTVALSVIMLTVGLSEIALIKDNIKYSLIAWGVILLIIGTLCIDTIYDHMNYNYHMHENKVNIFIWIVVMIFATSIKLSKKYTSIQVNLMIFILSLLNINATLVIYYNQSSLTKAIFTLVILATSAILAASFQYKKLFNLFLIFTSLRFIALYFQALGSLATTGAGLVLAGVLIMFLALFWKKYTSKITTNIERWNNDAR